MYWSNAYRRLWGCTFAIILAVVFAFVPGLALAADITVLTAGDLATNLSSNGEVTIQLGNSIEVADALTVNGKKTLELNGHTLTFGGTQGQSLFVKDAGAASLMVYDYSVDGSGGIALADGTTLVTEDGVSVALKGGTYSNRAGFVR